MSSSGNNTGRSTKADAGTAPANAQTTNVVNINEESFVAVLLACFDIFHAYCLLQLMVSMKRTDNIVNKLMDVGGKLTQGDFAALISSADLKKAGPFFLMKGQKRNNRTLRLWCLTNNVSFVRNALGASDTVNLEFDQIAVCGTPEEAAAAVYHYVKDDRGSTVLTSITVEVDDDDTTEGESSAIFSSLVLDTNDVVAAEPPNDV